MGDKGWRAPGAAPSETGRRRGYGVLPRTVGIVLVAVLVVGGCATSAPEDGAAQAQSLSTVDVVESPGPTAPAPTAPPAPPAADTSGPLTPDSQLRPVGLGPVKVSMTVVQAEQAGGVKLLPYAAEFRPACWFVVPEGWQRGSSQPPVQFMVRDGRITHISVLAGSTTTLEGIRIGSTEQDVREAYPDQIVATTDRLGQRLLIYIPSNIGGPDTEFSYSAMAFESDGHQVTGMRAGGVGDVVTFDEGCA